MPPRLCGKTNRESLCHRAPSTGSGHRFVAKSKVGYKHKRLPKLAPYALKVWRSRIRGTMRPDSIPRMRGSHRVWQIWQTMVKLPVDDFDCWRRPIPILTKDLVFLSASLPLWQKAMWARNTKGCLYGAAYALKVWRRPTLPPGLAVPSARAGLTSLFGMGRGGHRR